MNAGNNPFFLNKSGELNLKLEPTLPGWLFDSKGEYSFVFLGKTLVTYHNPKKCDTFTAKINKIVLDGLELDSDTIPAPYSNNVRSRQISKIDIYLD
jgi:hypothetical protein